MKAYGGELSAFHPFYSYNSPAAARDMDLENAKHVAGPDHLSRGIQVGSWSVPVDKPKASSASFMNSNKQDLYDDLEYTEKDIESIMEWTKRQYVPSSSVFGKPQNL